MSTSYYAHTVIGIKLSEHQTRPVVRKRGCQHEVPKNARFCPTCGKPATVEDREYKVRKIHGDWDEESVDKEGFSYIVDPDEETYIGVISSTSYNDCSVKMEFPDIESIKKKLKALLKPHDLWWDGQFGVYTVITVC